MRDTREGLSGAGYEVIAENGKSLNGFYRLKDGKYFSDLIDFDVTDWKSKRVTVYAHGVTGGVIPATTCWANPVEVDNDGMRMNEAVAGAIYLVTADAGAQCDIGPHTVGLVAQPGFTLGVPASDTHVIVKGN